MKRLNLAIILILLYAGAVFGQGGQVPPIQITKKPSVPVTCLPTSSVRSIFWVPGFGLYQCPTGTTPVPVGGLGSTSGFTAGTIPFAGTSGVLSQDNTGFFYDNTAKTLKLRDSAYNFASAGWNGNSILQLANRTSPYDITAGGTSAGYGGKFDYYAAQSSGSFTQTSGLKVRANNALTGGTGITTSVEAFVTNTGTTASSAGSMIQALEGVAQASNNVPIVVAGDFYANMSSGGSGTAVPLQIGVRSNLSSFSQFSNTDTVLFDGKSALSNGPTTNQYGLRFTGWTGSAVTNSYGIYMDTSIDRGSTLKYALYSLSTSPSLFSGTVALGSGGAVASAGTIAITGNLFHVTGTTNITSVSGTGVNAGTCSTIIFDGVLTFTDGSNLKLAGNFVTTADDTITICYDGTNWFETARAVN